MKTYYISKDTRLSGQGDVAGYYHLLIDFIIPLYVHSDGDSITLHVNSGRLNPEANRSSRAGVMSKERIQYIIKSVFGDRITIKPNKHDKSSGEIWLDVNSNINYPLHDILKDNDQWVKKYKITNPLVFRGIWGDYDKSHYTRFRNDMYDRYKITTTKQSYVTIIKRGVDARPRSNKEMLVNSPKLIQDRYETNLPVRIIDFSKLSFEETIRICAETKILIGQHGAGISNCVFMRPGSKIIEYEPITLPCYYILAKACGLQYEHSNLRDEIINIHE